MRPSQESKHQRRAPPSIMPHKIVKVGARHRRSYEQAGGRGSETTSLHFRSLWIGLPVPRSPLSERTQSQKGTTAFDAEL